MKPAEYASLAERLARQDLSVALPPLEVDLNVLACSAESRSFMSINEPGILPVRYNQLVRIEVVPTRAAWLYVVWINPEGKVQPLHPATPGNWTLLATNKDACVPRLELPPQASDGKPMAWSFEASPGVETVLVIASEKALTAVERQDLARSLAGLPPAQGALDAARPYLFGWSREQRLRVQQRLDLRAQPVSDPITVRHLTLQDRLQPHFPTVSGVSFVNAGKTRNRS